MRIRPWPIVILAVIHILAPVVNIFYAAWLMNWSVYWYLHTAFMAGNKAIVALYLFGFPVAGVAIYKTNRWSYPIFLVVMFAMMTVNTVSWRQYPQYFSLLSLLFTYFVNLSVVTYFLIPEVRSIYFNPRLRWWETKPRYDVDLPVRLQCGEVVSSGMIQNLSEGGCFIESDVILLLGNRIDLSFSTQAKDIKITGETVHVRDSDVRGYGVQFVHDAQSAQLLKETIRLTKKSGAQERIGNVSFWEEFKSWFVTAVSTGEGLIPRVPRN